MNPPAQHSLLRKFIGGELRFGFWGIVSRGIGWTNSFFIISALTVYQYGVFQLFLSAYAALADFISWGGLAAGTEILRAVGQGKEARAKRLFCEFNGLRIVSAVFLWALFFFGAPFLAFRYGPDFIDLIRVMSCMFLAEVFLTIVKSLITMRLNFRAIASRSAIGKSFQLAILLGFYIFSTIGLKEVLMSLVIGHVASTVILLPSAFKAWKPWRTVRAEQGSCILWKIARAHGKWDSMKNFLSQIVFRAQPWLIKFFVSTEAVGIYSVAGTLADVVTNFIPTKTISTLVTRIFHDKERSRRVFVYGVKYYVLLATAAAAGALCAVPVIVHTLLPQYASALPFFYLLLIAVPIKELLRMVDLFLIIFRQQKFAFFRMLTRNAVALVALLVFLPTIGLWGLPITEIIIKISFTYASYRYLLTIKPEFRISFRLFFSFGAEDRTIVRNSWSIVKSFWQKKMA